MSTQPQKREYWFIFQNDLLLLQTHNEQKLPSTEMLPLLASELLRKHPLGIYNGVDCHCAEVTCNASLPSTLAPTPLRKAFEILGNDWFVMTAKAFSIITWDKNHYFCGRCGHQTIQTPETFERLCQACGLALYPRISPSVIVLIKNGDHLLMSRSPHFAPGSYGLIAGFVEVGESIENAVHREVKEEVNLTIKNLKYISSQSWPFPDSLMIGFTADYAGGDLMIDPREIESAGWYRYDNLPGRPSKLSIAGKLIDQFVTEQTELSSI